MKTYADWFDTQDSTSDDDLSLRRSTVRTLNFGWAGQNDCACTIIRSIVIFYLYACTCRQQSRVILSPRTITPTAIVSGCLQMLTWVSDRSIFNTFGPSARNLAMFIEDVSLTVHKRSLLETFLFK